MGDWRKGEKLSEIKPPLIIQIWFPDLSWTAQTIDFAILDFELKAEMNDKQFLGYCILDWETLTGFAFSSGLKKKE